MIRINIILGISLLLFTTFSFAQTTPAKSGETSYIDVTGTAEKEVIPDEIFINITLLERYINKEKLTIEVQEVNLKQALKSIGIDLKDLYVSDINADFVKIRRQKKDVLTKKDYTLKVSNAATIAKVFAELDKLDITDAYISKVHHSKIDSLKKEVRIMAIKAAKQKADYLLEALGEQTGKVLVVTDSPDPVQPYYPMPRVMTMAQEAVPPAADELQFQKIKLSASIYVKFAIQ
jgi:uncharacterized protein YggE